MQNLEDASKEKITLEASLKEMVSMKEILDVRLEESKKELESLGNVLRNKNAKDVRTILGKQCKIRFSNSIIFQFNLVIVYLFIIHLKFLKIN